MQRNSISLADELRKILSELKHLEQAGKTDKPEYTKGLISLTDLLTNAFMRALVELATSKDRNILDPDHPQLRNYTNLINNLSAVVALSISNREPKDKVAAAERWIKAALMLEAKGDYSSMLMVTGGLANRVNAQVLKSVSEKLASKLEQIHLKGYENPTHGIPKFKESSITSSSTIPYLGIYQGKMVRKYEDIDACKSSITKIIKKAFLEKLFTDDIVETLLRELGKVYEEISEWAYKNKGQPIPKELTDNRSALETQIGKRFTMMIDAEQELGMEKLTDSDHDLLLNKLVELAILKAPIDYLVRYLRERVLLNPLHVVDIGSTAPELDISLMCSKDYLPHVEQKFENKKNHDNIKDAKVEIKTLKEHLRDLKKINPDLSNKILLLVKELELNIDMKSHANVQAVLRVLKQLNELNELDITPPANSKESVIDIYTEVRRSLSGKFNKVNALAMNQDTEMSKITENDRPVANEKSSIMPNFNFSSFIHKPTKSSSSIAASPPSSLGKLDHSRTSSLPNEETSQKSHDTSRSDSSGKKRP